MYVFVKPLAKARNKVDICGELTSFTFVQPRCHSATSNLLNLTFQLVTRPKRWCETAL